MTALNLGKVGIWSSAPRFAPDQGEVAEAVAELDALGYGALWMPGAIDGEVLGDVDRMLDAAPRIPIATGIINVWKNSAEEVAAWFAGQTPERQSRIMAGIGISHAPVIGGSWKKPLTLMREYCDGLDAGGVPRENVCIAALGPKMVALSGERTAGTHPYLVTPEHSAICREILGPGKLVAPEQGVVLTTDPEIARTAVRKALKIYLPLPNYRNSWNRLGFSDAEIDAVSDDFIDAIFAWGTPEKIADRVRAHHDAGADHVCLQVIPTSEDSSLAPLRQAWRELAAELL